MSRQISTDAGRRKTSNLPMQVGLNFTGFGLVIGLLLVSGFVGYSNVNHLAATDQQVSHTYEVVGALETVISTLKDAETGQRGFLLTEDDSYLEPFNAAIAKLDRDISRIKQLTADNGIQQLKIAQFETIVAGKIEELKQTISDAKNRDRETALSTVRSGKGQAAMESLRKNISEMQAIELELLAKRNIQATRSRNSTVWSILVSTVLGTLLTGWVMWLNDKNMRQRKASFDAVTEQKELLATTLASIGDGVITTDQFGIVTNLNPIAEDLTGWKNLDAVGVELTKIFNIVNETSRQPVSNPAIKALEQGIIVGLANHTILIAKNGTERFIDDSAAPIRSTNGAIVGCVLVFRDISERRLLENQVAERLIQARLLASIVESSSDAIISKSLDGTIQTWNKGAQLLFGFTAEESVGKHISLLIPPERLADEEELLSRLRQGETVMHFETVRRRSNAQIVDVSINLSPILDDSGKLIGASKIARDITLRKKTEEELRQLAAKLSDSSRLKDEFLATLAHELRNPLAPIRNGLELIRLSQGSAETIEEVRGVIERQVAQLVRLVDDLLDVSRISRGKLEMRMQPIALTDAINIAVETSRPIIDEYGHKLTIVGPTAPVIVDADLVRLGQVFSNLLNNAAKYSEYGGQITLSVETSGDQVFIRVKDTGIGIPSEMLSKVFEMFTQVDSSLERSQGGLGIGLTLVKRLVEMHHGTIEVKSEGRGKGSEFIICLPIVTKLTTPSDGLAKIESRDVSAIFRILVADDNIDSAKTLAMILTFDGNELQIARDGMEAVQLAESFRPDVILLDIGMPKLNGYETCRKIRSATWGKSIVIVALTGWGQDEDKRKSQEAGFTHHLVKPVDLLLLKQLLLQNTKTS